MAEKAEILLSAKDATSPAFASAKRNLEGFNAAAVGIAGRLGAIGAAIATAAVAFDRFNPKPIIDQADQLNKLSQRTGVAVEQLSGYQYAAKLADVSNEELATSFKKLNINIAAAARGETEQASAFKAIGVSVTDASGKVRSADQVFQDIAERFSGYEDGANKVALANALGGKSFERLIPLLNGGKKGLADAREELDKFGGVISAEFAAKAEKFNDNLVRLEQSSQALKISLASGIIDKLVELSDRMVSAAKNGGLLGFALERLGEVLSGKATRDFVSDSLPEGSLKAARKNVDDLSSSIARLQDYLARNPSSSGTLKSIEALQDKLAVANGDLKTAAFKSFRASERAGADFSPAPVPKKAAPALAKSGSAGADNADALLRKQLDGRLRAIQANLENERDLFQFADQRLAEIFNNGDVSIAQYYDRKNQAQLAFLATQGAGFDKLIEAQREYERKASKPQDKEDARNKIAEIETLRTKGLREAGQAAETAETQRQRAIEEFQRSLKDLDAQFADLSGDKYGADLLRNSLRFDEARKLLSKGGGDDARLTKLQDLLKTQADFNRLQDASARISEKAQVDEESFLIKAQRAGTSRNEVEGQLLALRTRSLDSLDALIAKSEQLVGASTDPAQLAFLEQLKLARERAFDVKDPGLVRFNELAGQVGQSLADGFENAIVSGDKLRDVVKALEKDLVRAITREGITEPLKNLFTNTIKGLGEGGTGGGFARLFSGILSGGAPKAQTGLAGQVAEAGGLQSKDLGGFFDSIVKTTEAAAGKFDASTANLIASTDRATSAFGALPGVLGQFASYVSSLLASTSGSSASSGAGFFASLFSGGGSTGFGTGSGFGYQDLGAFFHAGGVVGDGGGNLRSVPSSAWRGAERYHRGGIAGLAADEVPAILRRREEVIRTDDPRHRDNGGLRSGPPPMVYSPQFVLQQPASLQTQQQLAKTAYEAAQRAYARNR